MDRTRLANGWAKMKAGTVMAKYKADNPYEFKALDRYIAALAAGNNPPEPALKTKYGDGLTDIIVAGLTSSAATYGEATYGVSPYSLDKPS